MAFISNLMFVVVVFLLFLKCAGVGLQAVSLNEYTKMYNFISISYNTPVFFIM